MANEERVTVEDGCVVVRTGACKWYKLDPARNTMRAQEDADSVKEAIECAVQDHVGKEPSAGELLGRALSKAGDIIARHEALAERVCILEGHAEHHRHHKIFRDVSCGASFVPADDRSDSPNVP